MDTLIGENRNRLEDFTLLRGQAIFLDDIKIPLMKECAFLRSPHPHALIKSIDLAPALKIPGVETIFLYDDIVSFFGTNQMPFDQGDFVAPKWSYPIILPQYEVCFVGEAIAMVVAENRYIAEDAVNAIRVDYEPLPAVSDCRDGLRNDSCFVHQSSNRNEIGSIIATYGDCDPCFNSELFSFSLSLKQHRGGAHPMEGRGVIASYDPKNKFMCVWSSTQKPHKLRNVLSELFQMEEEYVRVILPEVGGGFGAKAAIYPEELIVAFASRKLGCPLKWTEDRREHFLSAIQERDQYWSVEVAFDSNGILAAIRGTAIHDQGAYTLAEFNIPYNCAYAVPGPYIVPNYHMEVKVVETNKVATVPVRGAGFPEANFVMERIMDHIANDLGIDRAEIRRRNLIPVDRIPYEVPLKARDGKPMIYDSGDFIGCLDHALKVSSYQEFSSQQQAALAEGRYIGIGVSNMLKVTGRGPFEGGMVKISRTGTVTIATGAAAMGQGTKTFLATICATELGLCPSQIKVITGDTSLIMHGVGGFASRQAVTAGNAVHLASRQVRQKALLVSSHILERPADDLYLADGKVQDKKDSTINLPFSEISKACSGAKGYPLPDGVAPGLEKTVYFEPKNLAYANASHVAEVEVDTDTGYVSINKYLVINDSGRIINPVIVNGQIRGGVAHGIGNALLEWMGYDGDAQPVVTTFAEYLLPTSNDVPNIEIYHFPTLAKNPIGVKGVGEVGTICAAATVISAVENALRPFNVQISEAPISPERLVELIHQ
ncbi:MAG: hypothetical protein CBB68_02895 [Rhodospirillaceae bacterium TMED8]|nr:dehydrogenase [Magnetovibrio sp.]OUT52317.1 MAG: hypothetical protein CBB68_02895 [Rhodospirillaceae bacterium TMED8]